MGRPGWYYGGHPPACTCVECNEGGRRSRSTTTATSDGGSGKPPKATASYEEKGDGGGRWKWIFIAIIAFVVIAVIGRVMEEDDTSPESTITPVSAAMSVHKQTATAINKPTIAASEKRIELPNLRHLNEKQYMLELINAERKKVGLNPVVLGDNVAAQLHAESALKNCFASHWGIDGLKPYMRYSLAGGYQSNGENGHGSDYCIKSGDRYTAITSVENEIRQAMDGWMNSPGHRRNILDKHHMKVNIGLVWDKYNFLAYQHFEGDYVEYDALPSISAKGILSFSGRTKNGVLFSSERDLGVQIYYDQPPHTLTRGQISRTYCYGNGRQVASLREPLTGRQFWTEDKFPKSYKSCPDPYDVPSNAPAPSSHEQAGAFWEEAYIESKNQVSQTIIVPWITALNWAAAGKEFSVTANIQDLLNAHGKGVYTITLWGVIDGEDVVISEYSIFHGVTPPDTYMPVRTLTPTSTPILAFISTNTATHTPVPMATLRSTTPTATGTSVSTDTPTPKPTNTPTAVPTATPTTMLPVCGQVELVLIGAGKQHKPCYTTTPTLTPGNARTAVSTQTVMPPSTATPIPTDTPTRAFETLSQPQIDTAELESLIHRLMNDERAKRGLKLLEHDDDIHQFIRMQIENMAKGEPITGYECVNNDRIHRTSSISITSIAPISSVSYRNGELVYAQRTEEEIAADIVSSWVEKPRNEDSYSRVGVGVGVTANGQSMTIILNFC